MNAYQCGIFRVSAVLALLGSAPSPGDEKVPQSRPNPGSSVYSGYGNYWYPSVYPYPSIGGPGYVQYGPGGAAGYYYSTPGSSGPTPALTSTNMGGIVRAVAPRVTPAAKPRTPVKPAPARRKAP